MDRDEMRNGDGPPAVRVLPAEGVHHVSPGPPDPGRPPQRRWLLPVVVVGLALLAFFAATRPTQQPDTEAAPPAVPPGSSQASTEPIDLTNPTATEATANALAAVEFQWSGRINDIAPYNNSLFAFGHDDEGAMAWLSGTGSGWRKAPRFERADNAKSSLDHAVVWDGDIVALGSVGDQVGLWTARTASHWIHHGIIPEMEGSQPLGLAATDKLLALAASEGRHVGWISTDGLAWETLDDVSDLDEMVVVSLVGVGDWFYAAGTERNTEAGRAVIYRSQDGGTWEQVNGLVEGTLSPEFGVVVDITGTNRGLLATGTVGEAMTVWSSADGQTWEWVSPTHEALLPRQTSIELEGISVESEAAGIFEINGQKLRLAQGSEVITDAGLLRVRSMLPGYVVVDIADDLATTIYPNESVSFTTVARPDSIAAQGPRIVITGTLWTGERRTPAIWMSSDGGQSWSVQHDAKWPQGRFTAAAVVGANISLIAAGNDPATPQLWHSTWNTQRMEDDGVALVQAFFGSIRQRNVEAILALLPAEQARFQLPSLGGVDLAWWDGTTGTVDAGAVGETIQYLQGMNTEIELGECRSRVQLGDIDSVRVSCGFDVDSNLLGLYSNDDHSGTAEIVVEGGGIQRMILSQAPSATMWQMLASSFGGQDPETRELLDDPTTHTIDPTFTAATASAHVQVAEEFIAGLLRPGDTRTIQTSFGTMEWTWLESLPLPVFHVNWLIHHGDEFVAVGIGEPEGWTDQTTLWTSHDGFTWEPMETPPGVTGMWNVQPFRDGLIAQAWERERSLLTFYDGTEWGEIELPNNEAGQYFDVRHLVTSSDKTLVVTVSWSGDYQVGPDAYRAWLIGPDDVLLPANLPAGLGEGDDTIGLAGSDEGFVLATANYGSPRSLQIWSSQDGQDWQQIATTTSIDNAAHIWNLQHHLGSFFVVGEGDGTNCATTEDGSSLCQHPVGLWSSPDGADWERVFTASGEPVGGYELGSGPLGLVALSDEFYGERPPPRPLYLSNGHAWERAGNLALLHPDAEWWWASRPAVGTDTIVIPGSAFDPRSSVNDEQPFFIIGRLVDG